MTTPRPTATSWDDLASPAEMHADCCAGADLQRLQRAARQVARPAPSIRFEDQPREARKPGIEISEATARLAAALHFHLE
ncbi:hypothetical protein [Nocardioides sp.]|uniref:hypothetical protein n=1 Tax=Nocardioides sp. TaxID=35761 RepID=UPI003512D0BF